MSGLLRIEVNEITLGGTDPEPSVLDIPSHLLLSHRSDVDLVLMAGKYRLGLRTVGDTSQPRSDAPRFHDKRERRSSPIPRPYVGPASAEE